MAAVPPAASCALATRLMVTKFVNDWASGVVSRTLSTAWAISSRWRSSSASGVASVCAPNRLASSTMDELPLVSGDASVLIIAPYAGSNQQVLRVRHDAFLSPASRLGSPALDYGNYRRNACGHGCVFRLPWCMARCARRLLACCTVCTNDNDCILMSGLLSLSIVLARDSNVVERAVLESVRAGANERRRRHGVESGRQCAQEGIRGLHNAC